MSLFDSATLPVSVAAAALVCACGAILRLVNFVQPTPYMVGHVSRVRVRHLMYIIPRRSGYEL